MRFLGPMLGVLGGATVAVFGCGPVAVEGPVPMKPVATNYQYRYSCGDLVLNDQLTSGGLPVTTWMPCWNVAEEAKQHEIDIELARDELQREAAAHDERVSDALVDQEAAACARIPPAERAHSPFVHRDEIASVLPHHVAGVLRGVLVEFRRVPGLDVDWMRRDIACHQAHVAVLGHVPADLASDPTVMLGAEVQVGGDGGRVTVVVTLPAPSTAARALAMVRATADGTTARR